MTKKYSELLSDYLEINSLVVTKVKRSTYLIEQISNEYAQIVSEFDSDEYDLESIRKHLLTLGEDLSEFLGDTYPLLMEKIAEKDMILIDFLDKKEDV